MIVRDTTRQNHILLSLIALLATGVFQVSAQQTATANTADTPAVGISGMVSSAHPLATEAGLKILDSGGNAFDAAVAVAAMLNVVEPMMSGIGGYGTILVYDASTEETWFLNPSGRIPAAVDSDAYREPTPGYRQNRRGAKAVSTPGNANAWEAMWERYGRLDWPSLFDPAIAAAQDGFALDERVASSIERAFSSFPAHAREFYGRNGDPLEAGHLLVQRDLARSLQLIASHGAAVVHGGGLGLAIHEAMREAEGFLSIDDLSANEAEWWEPIAIPYRGYEIVTAAPPANSFPALVRLGMMSLFDPSELGHNSAEYLHTFAEVTKHGFWTRLRWAGDPEVSRPPLEVLLSETYWREEVAKINPDQAKAFEPPTSFSNGDSHTTHFVVADLLGNVVSATQTLGNAFGSRIMPEGTGIWLNNSLAYCTFEPKGNPMDAFPGRHKLSGDVPLFVMQNEKPWIVIGTPGGHTIGQTVPQIVMNAVDFGMDIQQAIAAPRISFFEPDSLAVEAAIPAGVRETLSAMGHKIDVARGLGNAHGLVIEYDANGRPIRFFGGADPRGMGSARGR
jgi:gamma-glutamyltranspeptidase/glutathione hydrolase